MPILPRFWPFQNRSTTTRGYPIVGVEPHTSLGSDIYVTTFPPVVRFPNDVSELPNLKAHALRALCGAMMDRHTDCELGHPFCFDLEKVPGTITLIAEVACQVIDGDGSFLVAIYLSQAVSRLPESAEPFAPMDYIVCLDFSGPLPDRKMVVHLLANGDYLAQYGPILNPVPKDHSSGRLDWDNSVSLYCDPEPSHSTFTYWPSGLSEGQQVVPQFKCLMLRGEWWIVDYDGDKGGGQQVAGLEVTDNPIHLTRKLPR